MSLPTGAIVPSAFDFPADTVPDGHLECDGSAVSRTTYAALFAIIGTTFGAGDGSTTFNVPNLQDRMAVGVGQGSGLTNRVLAATGGAATHALSSGENASHNHDSSTKLADVYGSNKASSGSYNAAAAMTALTSGSAGSGSAHANLPAYLALHFLIVT